MDNLRSKTNSNFPTTVHTEYQRIIDQYLRVIMSHYPSYSYRVFRERSYSIYANTFVRASLDGIYIYSKYIWRVAAAISRILKAPHDPLQIYILLYSSVSSYHYHDLSLQIGDPDVIFSERGDRDSASETSVIAILSVLVKWHIITKQSQPINCSSCLQ